MDTPPPTHTNTHTQEKGQRQEISPTQRKGFHGSILQLIPNGALIAAWKNFPGGAAGGKRSSESRRGLGEEVSRFNGKNKRRASRKPHQRNRNKDKQRHTTLIYSLTYLQSIYTLIQDVKLMRNNLVTVICGDEAVCLGLCLN